MGRMAMIRRPDKRSLHTLEFVDFAMDIGSQALGNRLDVGTGAARDLKFPAFLDRET